ncbi:MAG: hypothetical protein JW982_09920 [Spirochaetes bacterium]|nr:hypothetical protein [Spirochaetota bacterium]
MKMHSALSGRRIIVTGGPTREYLDPVRFISNASSGKMGAALVQAARNYSDDVMFIHGPVDTAVSEKITCTSIAVESNLEMLTAVRNNLKDGSIIIMSAAPVDYKPETFSSRKIKKTGSKLSFDFILNIDILKSVSDHIKKNNMKNMFICGFAAETDNFIENAMLKIKKKNMDMICLNDVTEPGSGFNTDTNRVTVISEDGNIHEIKMASKNAVADEILAIIDKKIGGANE